MLILDSCFAGDSFLNVAPGEQKDGNFSRLILSSCLPGQLASDGPQGRGSAFANAFYSVLDQNQQNFLSFDDMKPSLKSKFAQSEEKLDEQQQFITGLVPGAQVGRGSFIFEIRDKNKPDIIPFKESLIEKLDFTGQRADLQNYYSQRRNKLNIITTQGSSMNVHRVLSKIIFRWMKQSDRIKLNPALCHISDPINIDKCEDEDIWRILYRQIKDDAGTLPDENRSILHWYFEKAASDAASPSSERHVILWIGFRLGGSKTFERIANFCEEFSELFFESLSGIEKPKQDCYGKIFIIVSDERVNIGAEHGELLKKLKDSKNFNFIPTQCIGDIRRNHVEDWIDSFSGGNLAAKIQELSVYENLTVWAGAEEFNFRYETFVENMCTHCEFTPQEVLLLHSYLYDFNKNYLIG
jgi:hypothetical protein